MVAVTSRLKGSGWKCEVDVEQDEERTHHTVTVTRADLDRWGQGGDVDDLVRRSFEFLLEREPASSILRSFDLSAIQRYFPDYDRQIRR